MGAMDMNWDIVPVTEAKTRLHELIDRVGTRPVLLMRRSRPAGVLTSFESWQEVRRQIEDLKDQLAVLRSMAAPTDLRLSQDKMLAELGIEAE